MDEIPKNLKQPTIAIAIKSDIVPGQSATDFRALSIVEKLPTGSAIPFRIHSVTSEDQVINLFGENSAGHLYYRTAVKNYRTSVNMMAIDPVGYNEEGQITGTPPTLTLSVSGSTTTSASNLELKVWGRAISVFIPKGNAAIDIASKISNALNELSAAPFSSSLNGEEVTITPVHCSDILGPISLKVEKNDTGFTIVGTQNYVPQAAATVEGEHSVAKALNMVGEEVFDFVAIPYSDNETLKIAKEWAESRAEAMSALDGQCLAVRTFDKVDDAKELRSQIESQTLTIVDSQALESTVEQLAAFVSKIARSSVNDPATPYQRIPLVGLQPVERMRNFNERELLLSSGISTLVSDGGELQIQRVATLADENSAFGDLNDRLTIAYLRRDFIRYLHAKYPRFKLGENGGTYAEGSNVITPNQFKYEFVARYKDWEERGWTEDLASIKDEITATKNGDAIEFNAKINLINQLRSIVGQFRTSD